MTGLDGEIVFERTRVPAPASLLLKGDLLSPKLR
jgi:hypothetical protein